MAEILLRPAGHDDLDALAAIHQASARAAYRQIFPPAARFPVEAARGEIALHLHAPAMRTTLAIHAGIPAGLVAAGPAAPLDAAPADRIGQIHLLHVHPDWQGHGIGTRLLEDALAWLGGAGSARAILWVLVLNRRARRFYERRGWIADGALRTEQHAIAVEIMRYGRRI
jgi:GNAT superfamily N-acetyltransferase